VKPSPWVRVSGSGRDKLLLGVFGGTFDPIHNGHLMVANEAAEHLGLDRILFVPAGNPWLKDGTDITDSTHRLAMVHLGIAGNDRLEVSDVEMKRPGPSYTVDTLEDLAIKIGNGAPPYLLVGIDALSEFYRWQNPKRVLELATVVGIRRPGFVELGREAMDRVQTGALQRVVLIKNTMTEISSTEIRKSVGQGYPIRDLVPEPVAEYIYEHGLYGSSRE